MKFFRNNEQILNDDELTAEEVRQIWRRQFRRRVLSITLPLLILVILSIIFVLPRVTEFRARQFASESQSLLKQGKLQEALNNASSAMQMRPDIPAVKRAFATTLLQADKPQAISVLQDLVNSPHVMAPDRVQLAEAALHFNDLALAESAAEDAVNASRTPDALFVLARTQLAKNHTEIAVQTLQECINAGQNPQASILLARLRLAANTPESIKNAIDLLSPIAEQSDKDALDALLTLITSQALGSDQGADWINKLQNHPAITDDLRFVAATAEIKRNPESYITVSRRMIEQFRSGTPEQRAQLARWLNQNREYQTVLDIITAEDAAKRSDFFLIRIDALAGGGQWAAIGELLKNDNIPLQPAIVLLYRGRAERETKNPANAASLYKRAIIEASNQPEMLWYVINYLVRIGEDEVLEQELLRLADNPTTARQAYQALVPIVQKRQEAQELFKLYENMIQRLPADPIVQNDHRYFAVLTGKTPDIDGAIALVNSDPKMFAYRVTLALALLKSGHTKEALSVFDGITVDPSQIQPYQRVVLAAVLGANGREDDAHDIAKNIPGDAVTKEEFELIKPWRDKD